MERKVKQILSESKVYLKAIELDNQDGTYLIGNCNMDIGLMDAVVRIIPPINDSDVGEALILNGVYNTEDFEEYLGEELNDLTHYYFGKINMDIRATGTVWKFFTKRYNDYNVLIINQTQRREDGERIFNPLEVKIFMRKRNLKNNNAEEAA